MNARFECWHWMNVMYITKLYQDCCERSAGALAVRLGYETIHHIHSNHVHASQSAAKQFSQGLI